LQTYIYDGLALHDHAPPFINPPGAEKYSVHTLCLPASGGFHAPQCDARGRAGFFVHILKSLKSRARKILMHLIFEATNSLAILI